MLTRGIVFRNMSCPPTEICDSVPNENEDGERLMRVLDTLAMTRDMPADAQTLSTGGFRIDGRYYNRINPVAGLRSIRPLQEGRVFVVAHLLADADRVAGPGRHGSASDYARELHSVR